MIGEASNVDESIRTIVRDAQESFAQEFDYIAGYFDRVHFLRVLSFLSGAMALEGKI